MIRVHWYCSIPVPLCATCARAHRRAWIRGARNGGVVGFALFIVGLVAMAVIYGAGSGGPRGEDQIVVALTLGLFAAPIAGALVTRVPFAVEARGYRWRDKTVELRRSEVSIRTRAAREASLAIDAVNAPVGAGPESMARRRSWLRGVLIGLVLAFVFECGVAELSWYLYKNHYDETWLDVPAVIGGIAVGLAGLFLGSRRWSPARPQLPAIRVVQR